MCYKIGDFLFHFNANLMSTMMYGVFAVDDWKLLYYRWCDKSMREVWVFWPRFCLLNFRWMKMIMISLYFSLLKWHFKNQERDNVTRLIYDCHTCTFSTESDISLNITMCRRALIHCVV
jgi:hypothetical protein